MISPGAAFVSIAMLLHPAHAPIAFQVASSSPSHPTHIVLARNGSVSFGNGTIMQANPNVGPSTSTLPVMKIDPSPGPSYGVSPVMKVDPQTGPSTSLPPIMRVDPRPQGSPSSDGSPVMKESPTSIGASQGLRTTED